MLAAAVPRISQKAFRFPESSEEHISNPIKPTLDYVDRRAHAACCRRHDVLDNTLDISSCHMGVTSPQRYPTF
ncbi:hypothetical protein AAMO2058_001468100 [Amorphochlora amoebiformis]